MRSSRLLHLLAALGVAAALSPAATAKEVYSNGAGGGDWSLTSTWRGGLAPGPDDVAVVSRDDEITFARDDSEAITCLELHVDPGGALRFQSRAGRVVMRIAGEVRSHGAIQLDASQARSDYMAIHLLAPDHGKRQIAVREGGSFTAVGRSDLGEGEYNVLLRADLPAGAEGAASGRLGVGDGCGMDLRFAHVDNVEVNVSNIDNTGAEFNERLNVEGNYFTREARLGLSYCDTAVVINNRFEKPEPGWVQPAAIALSVCPLAEVRGNRIKGWYYYGIHSYASTDVSVLDNTIESAYVGVHWYGQNVMVQRLLIRKASTGVQFNYGSGAIDGMITEEVGTGLLMSRGIAQVSNWLDRDPKRKAAVDFHLGRLVLINTNISADQVTVRPNAKLIDDEADFPLVRSMQYVVVGVTGDAPPGALVEIQTAGWTPPRPGAADLNVRNSPAPLSNIGLTPRPATMRPLIVQSWLYGEDLKLAPTPTYDLRIVKPEGDAMKVLKAVQITPVDEWFRADPNAPEPTVEVKLD